MKKTSQKGITLIALIVSIIVMLILTLVTINIIYDGKLIEKTKEAREKTELEMENELNQSNTAGYKIAISTLKGIRYIPTEGEQLNNIYINPKPIQYDILMQEGEITEDNIAVIFEEDENNKIIMDASKLSETEPQYIRIMKTEVRAPLPNSEIYFEMYIRVWENGDFNIGGSTIEYTLEEGWNKITYTIISDGITPQLQNLTQEVILENQLPNFTGEFTIQTGFSEDIGYFIGPTPF